MGRQDIQDGSFQPVLYAFESTSFPSLLSLRAEHLVSTC